MRYDPDQAPDAAEWLAMDEGERIAVSQQYHKRKKVRLPNATLHSTIHAVVETQIAMGDETPARETLDRLLAEGLSRHDAVHAIGSALARHLHALLSRSMPEADANERYLAQLRELTAEKWRNEG